jgi:hypothetical protein
VGKGAETENESDEQAALMPKEKMGQETRVYVRHSMPYLGNGLEVSRRRGKCGSTCKGNTRKRGREDDASGLLHNGRPFMVARRVTAWLTYWEVFAA